jgi:hypothetical protein
MQLAIFHFPRGARAIINENIFSEVKERLTLPDTVKYYGLKPSRNGFINCIFHNEKTPSMKLYLTHFHCYGCGEHGDIIKLTGQLFSLSPFHSVKKIAQDFNIIIHDDYKYLKSIKPKISEQMKYVQEEKRIFELINDYCKHLKHCREIYRPTTPEDELHPLFVESLLNYDKYNYYLDIFIIGTDNDRKDFISTQHDLISLLEQKLYSSKNEKEQINLERAKKDNCYNR